MGGHGSRTGHKLLRTHVLCGHAIVLVVHDKLCLQVKEPQQQLCLWFVPLPEETVNPGALSGARRRGVKVST